jgi:hypothetical protein
MCTRARPLRKGWAVWLWWTGCYIHMLDFLHDFVEKLTSGCMEAFMVASISFSWLECLYVLFESFVVFSCATRFIDCEAFVFGFVCREHG